jgi:chromosome segregation ATPase
VFHADCAKHAYRSKLKLAEQRNRELESQLADTRRAAARVEIEANHLRNETTSLSIQLDNARGQLAIADDRLQAHWDDLQAVRSQNAALRTELTAIKTERQEQKQDGEIDGAAESRFKLLELR